MVLKNLGEFGNKHTVEERTANERYGMCKDYSNQEQQSIFYPLEISGHLSERSD